MRPVLAQKAHYLCLRKGRSPVRMDYISPYGAARLYFNIIKSGEGVDEQAAIFGITVVCYYITSSYPLFCCATS